jgi:phosphohistidine phosphatase SixA
VTQQLYLLRHAEAEAWNPLGNDFSRPLSSPGHRHAELISRWADETLTPPDTILCSPARRTRETLAPLLALWPRLLGKTEYTDSMYGASLDMLLTLAQDAFSYSETLMMVGHNPGIEHMLANSAKPAETIGTMQMSTGTVAVIEFPRGFKKHAHAGKLLQLTGKDTFSLN